MNSSTKNKKRKNKTNKQPSTSPGISDVDTKQPSTTPSISDVDTKQPNTLQGISDVDTHAQLRKTMSNLSKTVKDKLVVWNCCFCPGLRNIDCCNSCEVDIHSPMEF
jgi:hypothetical protein